MYKTFYMVETKNVLLFHNSELIKNHADAAPAVLPFLQRSACKQLYYRHMILREAMDSEDKDLYKTCSCLAEHVSLKYSFLIIIPKVGLKQNCQFYSCDGQLYLPADKRG